jgi:4'-phosphopantetheinyl transferase EntD
VTRLTLTLTFYILHLTDFTAEEEVLLRFSLKESLYKAIHPYVQRFIGLRSVEIDPTDFGTASIQFVDEEFKEKIGIYSSSLTATMVANKEQSCILVVDRVKYKYITHWDKLCDHYCITAVKISIVK